MSGPTLVRSRRSRRARFILLVVAGMITLVAATLVILRPRPVQYTPGRDAGAAEGITKDLSRTLPEGAPSVRFTDAAREAGIDFTHFSGRRTSQLPEDMGSGAAWGDYDNDGDPDLFLVNEEGPLTPAGGSAGPAGARCALYRNDGHGRFTDVTEAAGVGARGWGMGAAWGDYDGDGDLDLVVTRFGTNILYRNNGDGTFTDVSASSGIGRDEGFWTGAAWADYDRDGDLDLYVAGYVRYRYDAAEAGRTSMQYRAVVPFTLNPSSYPPERNLLYRNDGGVFHEVARQAGVDNPSGRSLSAAWCDFDADGWPDLYVANDISDNAMFRNLGNGRFEDISHSAWVADYRGAMGLGIGDWDNDGDLDIFITHWLAQENALYDNQRRAGATRPEPLHFLDVADQVGLGQIALDYIGWGTGFIDYDNDGRLDLFVVNGSTFQREDDPSRLVPMRNLLFWNAGRQKGFYEVGQSGGPAFDAENVGRGAAFADFDGDGDLDALVVVNGGAARLLRNDGGNANGWLRVVLRGRLAPAGGAGQTGAVARAGPAAKKRVTTSFAIGARVSIEAAGLRQIAEVGAGPSYLSQSPPGEVRFGIGAARSVDLLEIAWPDGSRQSFRDLPARATVTLVEGGKPSIGTDAPGKESVVRFWNLFNQATSRRMQGDPAEAARLYEEALSLQPRHEDCLYYLGQCRRTLGRYAPAREAFTALVEANPESARGHLALGALLASPDEAAPIDLATAEAHFRRAHAINREETGPMVRLGEVLIARGEKPEARSWLESALRTNPRSVEAAFLLGFLSWDAGDLPGARAACRKAVRAASASAPVRGVLSEGDRKAAPAVEEPMGKTLFGRFAGTLRAPGAAADGAAPDPDLDHLYGPVRRAVQELRSRIKPAR